MHAIPTSKVALIQGSGAGRGITRGEHTDSEQPSMAAISEAQDISWEGGACAMARKLRRKRGIAQIYGVLAF
jgi:hypothetical protein